MKELGIDENIKNIKGNDTYQICNKPFETIIKKHQKITKEFKPKTTVMFDKLPIIYATPKLHKNPVKFRFITAAKNCSTTEISCLLKTLLSHFKNHFRNYCNTIKNSQNKKVYWSINGSQELREKLKSIKQNKNLKIFSADFTSLFPNLKHTVIIQKIRKLIDILFKASGYEYITICNNKCYYTSPRPNDKRKLYHMIDIFELIDNNLSESYTTFGEWIFKQIQGVPQGGNASPDIADLTLSMIEYEFLKENQNTGIEEGFRYVDDLLLITTNKFNENLIDKIYKKDLNWEKTNINDNETHYLDLTVSVKQDKIVTKLYNKTDDYNFNIQRITNYDTYMPDSIKKGIIKGEMIRIYRSCSNKKDFKKRCNFFINELKNANYPSELIYNSCNELVKQKRISIL